MNGRRVYPDDEGKLYFSPGDYGKLPSGEWLARPPREDVHTGTLINHEVTEHEDGTITVSPSILITGHENDTVIQWHGYLQRGVWTEC